MYLLTTGAGSYQPPIVAIILAEGVVIPTQNQEQKYWRYHEN